jgi:hypothetical protein
LAVKRQHALNLFLPFWFAHATKKKDRNSYCWRSATGVLDASRRRLLLCRPNCAVSAVLFAAAEIVT